MTMTTATLAELARLEREATPGEWVVEYPEIYSVTEKSVFAEPVVWLGTTDKDNGGVVDEKDALFIAAMRNHLPALLAEIARLRERAERLCGWCGADIVGERPYTCCGVFHARCYEEHAESAHGPADEGMLR